MIKPNSRRRLATLQKSQGGTPASAFAILAVAGYADAAHQPETPRTD
jgi:hypothetical protein